jgi:hypothetical protein
MKSYQDKLIEQFYKTQVEIIGQALKEHLNRDVCLCDWYKTRVNHEQVFYGSVKLGNFKTSFGFDGGFRDNNLKIKIIFESV